MATNTILKDYLELAQKYKGLADRSLEELNKCKQEILQLKAEILERLQEGQFLWDENRIVISAPEIIIGNVNRNGELVGSGKVFIKGGDIKVDGVGTGGSIVMRSPVIEQRAVDPGDDGNSEIVYQTSRITSEARQICLSTRATQDIEGKGGVFLPPTFGEGITLTSDTNISLNGTIGKSAKKDSITTKINPLGQKKSNLINAITSTLATLGNQKNKIEQDVEQDKKLTKDNDLTRTNILALDELQIKEEKKVVEFLSNMRNVVDKISQLAETNRQMTCLKAEYDKIAGVTDDNFKNNPTKTSVNINSENINLKSEDGDGKVRTNPGAGILLRGNNIKLESKDEKGALTPDTAKGRVSVSSRNIELSTANFEPTYDAAQKLTSANYPAEGNVTIRSKTVDIESMNYKYANDKYEEELTEGSSINIRSEKVKVKTINHEGKSVGKFSVNSQKITMKATDIKEYNPQRNLDDQGNYKHPDKEKMKSDKVAEGSTMLLLAETMSVGFKENKEEQMAKTIQITGNKEVFLYGKGESLVGVGNDKSNAVFYDKACVTTGNDLELGGKNINIIGKIALEGEVTAGDVKVQNLEAEKSVKAPNIADGIGVPLVPKQSPPTEQIGKNLKKIDEEEE